jgi:hypothetical protein
MGYKSGDWEKDIKSLKASARVCGLSLVDEAFSVIKTASETTEETTPETPTNTETPTEPGVTGDDDTVNDANDEGD